MQIIWYLFHEQIRGSLRFENRRDRTEYVEFNIISKQSYK